MSFSEYYKHYLSLHQNKACRRLHVVGQLATLAMLALIVWTGYWLLLLILPFVVYPFAWSGHFFFEHNKPAAFKRPIWAKACDWIMLWQIITGKLPL